MSRNVLPFWLSVELRVLVIKGYSIFPKLRERNLTIKCTLILYLEEKRLQQTQ